MEYPIKLDIGYEEKASRLEVLIIRWLYAIVLYIVLYIWAMVAGIVWCIQGLHILILGRRNQSMHDFISGYLRFVTRVYGYLLLLTDARPPISGR
jgi:fucose permease